MCWASGALAPKGIIFLGKGGFEHEVFILTVVSNICSINFSAIGKQNSCFISLQLFYESHLWLQGFLKSICKSILLGKMSQPMNDGTSLDLLQSCYYLRFGAAAMAVATLAEGCFNYVLRPCFNAVSYAAWLEWCVFQKWVLDGWMNGFSVSW